MARRVELRVISNDEGNRLLRLVRRSTGSVVTWRRAQIVLLSAQGMSAVAISEVVFTDADTVREVIHNFNRDGFDALYPRYRGGRPPRGMGVGSRQRELQLHDSTEPRLRRGMARAHDERYQAK
jgi:Winged helix-turn helix